MWHCYEFIYKATTWTVLKWTVQSQTKAWIAKFSWATRKTEQGICSDYSSSLHLYNPNGEHTDWAKLGLWTLWITAVICRCEMKDTIQQHSDTHKVNWYMNVCATWWLIWIVCECSGEVLLLFIEFKKVCDSFRRVFYMSGTSKNKFMWNRILLQIGPRLDQICCKPVSYSQLATWHWRSSYHFASCGDHVWWWLSVKCGESTGTVV